MEYIEYFSEYPDLIKIEDIMNMLEIGRNSAYKLLQNGSIKTIRVGKKYIIPKRSVVDFLNNAV